MNVFFSLFLSGAFANSKLQGSIVFVFDTYFFYFYYYNNAASMKYFFSLLCLFFTKFYMHCCYGLFACVNLLIVFWQHESRDFMTGNPPEAEKRTEKGKRGGTEIEAGTGMGGRAGTGREREAGTRTEIGRKAKTGNVIGMGRRNVNVTVTETTIIEIGIGIVVREEKGEGIETMMMIITEVGTMTGKRFLGLEIENFIGISFSVEILIACHLMYYITICNSISKL